MLGREPTIIIQSIVAALNVVQIAAIGMPTVWHSIVAALIIGLGALVNRQAVTPVVGSQAS